MSHPSELTSAQLQERRERVFLVLAGLFLGTMAMLNILGISRFVDVSTPFRWIGSQLIALGGWVGLGNWIDLDSTRRFVQQDWLVLVAVGVLPYPVTFLCTDLISEFYGRSRANFLVALGVMLNLWIVLIFQVAAWLPPSPPEVLTLDTPGSAFWMIKTVAFGAVVASMIAFVLAQFVDVYLYHFWKRLARGKALWLRNNGSTLVSQLLDTTVVILITYFLADKLPINPETPLWPQLGAYILNGYVFKMACALLDTPLIYLAVAVLKGYLKLDPREESKNPFSVKDADSSERLSS